MYLKTVAAVSFCLSMSALIDTSMAQAPSPSSTVNMEDVLKSGTLPDMVLGSATAPVTVIQYTNLSSPYTKKFHTAFIQSLKSKIDSGKVRYVLREFPMDQMGTAAFMVARCDPRKSGQTSDSSHFYKAVDAFSSQQNLDVIGTAKKLGMSDAVRDACLENQSLVDALSASRDKAAGGLGISSTPTVIINGKVFTGDMTPADLSPIIDGA